MRSRQRLKVSVKNLNSDLVDMLPAYFGHPPDFFGITHMSETNRRSHSLIICQPLLGEAIWTHWALKQIAQWAAREGYDVFRFDFSGTGNSMVDSTTLALANWTGDVEKALDLMEERCGNSRVSVLAVRLGFAVAASVSFRRDIENLIGWDPVLDGRTWLADRKIDLEDHGDGTCDLQGIALQAEFLAELEALEIRNVDSVQATAVTTASHTWDYPPEHMGIDVIKSTDTWNWREPLPALFYAHESVRLVCEQLS